MSVDGNKLLNLAGAQALYNNLREILDTKLNNSLKGTPNGLAELDSSGKVPASQLPSYVDDVVEFTRLSSFPVPGQGGKIYVALDTNLTYRWSGTSYVQISSALALGETSTTAYRGDRGAAAYSHANNKGSAFSSGLYKITTNSQGHVTNATPVVKQDITKLGVLDTVPTKTSELVNDAGFITSFTETDPTVPAWAKAATKPSYTANEVGALPSTTVIPDKTSDLQNDSNFITDTELENLILIQNAQPVNNDNKIWIPETAETFTQIPTMEDIPTKVSQLTNDSGYLTSVTETINGTSPIITATANHHYICGEVTSLSFTPSASGVCDVRFTSGTTATALTVPNTVKWPSSFNPAALETNTVYRLSVQDGIYGMVAAWSL